MPRRVSSIAFFLYATIQICFSSHFRGGIITWKSVDFPPNTVQFQFKNAWRRSYSSEMACNQSDVQNRKLIGADSNWNCIFGCPSESSIGSTRMHCTSFSTLEDWSQGENTFSHTFSGTGPFVVSFQGGDWISTLAVGAGSSWTVPTTVDLRPRSDNGQINSSPVSGTAPIIRLQEQCTYTLPIHADDPDGDKVRCRWAQAGQADMIIDDSSYTNDECGGVCNALPGATLDSVACQISFRTSNPGWYAVALILEDFVSSESDTPLSEVPLQFLLEVRESIDGSGDEACQTKLKFADRTLDDRHCVAISPGGTFMTSVVVIEDADASLREILLVKPQGVSQSDIKSYGFSEAGLDITWTPTEDQYGQQPFCFSALDTSGQSTEQRCLTLLAGVSSPAVVEGSYQPFGTDVSGGVRRFSVTFDQEIRRPTLPRYVTLVKLGDEDNFVDSFDTSVDSRISISNRMLSFSLELDAELEYKTHYYVIIEPGAVVGLQSCVGGGSPFPGISKPTEWYFITAEDAVHPCDENNGTGDCEFECVPIGNTYQCWCDSNNLFELALDGHSCQRTDAKCECHEETGVCRGAQCECRYGWKGERCDVPACHFLAECSGNGLCVSPGYCSCKPGWGGPACNVDICSQHRFCDVCSKQVGCGWCDAVQRCMVGTGDGPAKQQCDSWWYHYCFAAVTQPSESRMCSNQISFIDYSKECINNNDLQATGPGSYEYCSRFLPVCESYASCYDRSGDGLCLSWQERNCPFGLLTGTPISPVNGETIGLPLDDIEGAARIVRELNVFSNDHGILSRIALAENNFDRRRGKDPSRWGLWSISKQQLKTTQTIEILSDLRLAVRRKMRLNWDTVSLSDMEDNILCGIAASFLLATIGQEIPSTVFEQAKIWINYFNKEGNLNDFVDHYQSKSPDCVFGIYDPRQAFCLCIPGYKGVKCDRHDCGCGFSECSGNGRCVLDATGEPRCVCTGIWTGGCCEIRPPVRNFGDPHLQTIDGFEFDYFGIGEFISCYSEANGFGVQLRFFKYKNTSMIGDVAIKIGDGVASLVSVSSPEGQIRMPQLRINGSLQDVELGKHLRLGGDSVTLFMRESNVSNSLVQLFFQFSNGATYTIEVRYSDNIGRQFLDTSLGAPLAFIKKTKGLCGNMDGDPTNDFLSPNGMPVNDVTALGESWRIMPSSMPNTTRGYVWDWNGSNFHPDDSLTDEYLDENHSPNYDLDEENIADIRWANETCKALGLQGKLLHDCTLDLTITGDVDFLQQQAFHKGECLSDCSNHGDCINGTCSCHGQWTGEACDEGGCEYCPNNSSCIHGFCVCDFGFYDFDGECLQASCFNVNNCTSLEHGRCKAPDECLCNPGFGSFDCSEKLTCYDNCSGHGLCYVEQSCVCDPNWGGERCNLSTCDDLQNCLGRGRCTELATCDCVAGWVGSNCGLPSCRNVNDCSTHGECISPDVCRCDLGYTGVDCFDKLLCPDVGNCSGNGLCLNNETCYCYSGFTGRSCETPICTDGCNGRGRCISADFCECDDNWIGANCSQPSCLNQKFCSAHGTCVEINKCQCDDFWKGDSCDIPDCPSSFNASVQCHGIGTCVGPAQCQCHELRYGNLCQTDVFPRLRSIPHELVEDLRDKGDVLNIGENYTRLAGERVVLSCYAEGLPVPSIRFYHENALKKVDRTVDNKRGALVFARLTFRDAGRYFCTASSNRGIDSKETVLTVLGRPDFVRARRVVKAYEGDEVRIKCKPMGEPKSNVTWTYGNTNSPVDTIKGVHSSGNGVSLVVRSMAARYQMTYTCTATNDFGQAKQTVNLKISTCRPRLRLLSVPECVATILITEESSWMANENRRLVDIVFELEKYLNAVNIGTRKNRNRYAVVGFGTEKKARIIKASSGEAFFRHNVVERVISKLRRIGQHADGYHAIRYALQRLPLQTVSHCVLHLLLVTDQPRTAVETITKEDIQSLLCHNQPILLTVLLNSRFVVSGRNEPVLGVDSESFLYFAGEQDNVIREKGLSKVQPELSTICKAFSDYGTVALTNNGSVWDLYELTTASRREVLVRAIADATARVILKMTPCRDCPCEKTKNGQVIEDCVIFKHPSYCRCRSDGRQKTECIISVKDRCNQPGNGNTTSAITSILGSSFLPPACFE